MRKHLGMTTTLVPLKAHSTITCIQSLTDFYDTTKIDLWPQTWQLIPLSSGIDLEQVLFDFDMSFVKCVYKGTNVIVTPRFFLTLLSGYNFCISAIIAISQNSTNGYKILLTSMENFCL